MFEWLTWAASELALVTDEKLAHLNSHLATRTFLAGNCTSLADLVVFGTIHPAVVSIFSLVETFGFCSLSLTAFVERRGYMKGGRVFGGEGGAVSRTSVKQASHYAVLLTHNGRSMADWRPCLQRSAPRHRQERQSAVLLQYALVEPYNGSFAWDHIAVQS